MPQLTPIILNLIAVAHMRKRKYNAIIMIITHECLHTACSLSIPDEKMADVLREYQAWKTKRIASRRDMQRLVGRLQYIAHCVRPARRYMSRILAVLRASPVTGKHAVPKELTFYVGWFTSYVEASNGIVLLLLQQKCQWTPRSRRKEPIHLLAST